VLFNEPKLLKFTNRLTRGGLCGVSVLFNEPKLLKYIRQRRRYVRKSVSVLFNEPKLLKSFYRTHDGRAVVRFSALQRAEIAEIYDRLDHRNEFRGFSALQRAEIAEILIALRRQQRARLFQCSSTSRNC